MPAAATATETTMAQGNALSIKKIDGLGYLERFLRGQRGCGEASDDVGTEEPAEENRSDGIAEQAQRSPTDCPVGMKQVGRGECGIGRGQDEIGREEPDPLPAKLDADRAAEIEDARGGIERPPDEEQQSQGQFEDGIGAWNLVGSADGRELARAPFIEEMRPCLDTLQNGKDQGRHADGDECCSPPGAPRRCDRG